MAPPRARFDRIRLAGVAAACALLAELAADAELERYRLRRSWIGSDEFYSSESPRCGDIGRTLRSCTGTALVDSRSSTSVPSSFQCVERWTTTVTIPILDGGSFIGSHEIETVSFRRRARGAPGPDRSCAGALCPGGASRAHTGAMSRRSPRSSVFSALPSRRRPPIRACPPISATSEPGPFTARASRPRPSSSPTARPAHRAGRIAMRDTASRARASRRCPCSASPVRALAPLRARIATGTSRAAEPADPNSSVFVHIFSLQK